MSNIIDVFISHASEDKVSVARPLYRLLKFRGYSVWFDESELKLGDSLHEKIAEGLSTCRFGVVIISPSFLSKKWPKRELDGLFAKEDIGDKVILPVWHDVEKMDVVTFSPILAGRFAVKSSDGIDKVAESIASKIGTPKVTQNTLPDELIREVYADACEGEDVFIEFCNDVIAKADFLTSAVLSLQKGIVEFDKARRVIENLSYLFLQQHMRFLFELVCLTYDQITVSNDAIRRMVERGLKKSEIVDASHFIPRTASVYFCRLVFDAFYNQGIGPTIFEGALFSPAFVEYCLNLDFDRMREIVESWKPGFVSPVLRSDAVACILHMIDRAATENTKDKVRKLLRKWYKSGTLDGLAADQEYEVRQAIM